MHKQHPQTAYRKYAILIGTIFENCDKSQKQFAQDPYRCRAIPNQGYLNSRLPIANGYLKFVCSGILCEAVSVILFGVFHFGDPEVRKMLKYLVHHIGKR